MPGSIRRIAVLFMGLFAAGCAQPMVNVREATFDPAQPSIATVVRYSGDYGIEYTLPGNDQPIRVAGREFVLVTGDRVGFRRGDDGKLVAVLPYSQHVVLSEIPPQATQVSFVTRIRQPSTYSYSQSSSFSTHTRVTDTSTGIPAVERQWDEQAKDKAEREARGKGFSSAKDYDNFKNGDRK
jgi:hypothetical protein